MEAIKNSFTGVNHDSAGAVLSASISKHLPVKPFTDIFAKMGNSNAYMVAFYKRVRAAVDNKTK